MLTLIAQARRASGLSQSDVAKSAGTSRPTLSAYERGHRNPTLDTLERLLEVNGQQLALTPRVEFTQCVDRRGKVFMVPDRLPQLPAVSALATVVLPVHVDWSTGQKPRALSDRRQRILAYQVILSEGEAQDIATYVDGALLVDAWPEMHLPNAIRGAWQPLIDQAMGSAT